MPLPAGFELEQSQGPKLPEGFVLEKPSEPTAMDRLGEAAKSAAIGGLLFGPLGVQLSAANKGMEAVDKAAYEAGGKVSELSARAGLTPETSAKLGFGTNVGIQAIPAVLGGEVGKLGAPAMRWGAEKMMQMALKPPAKMLAKGYQGAESAAAKAGQTAIDERILTTEGGGAKTRELLNKVEADKQALLAGSTATVDKAAVASRLQDVTKRFTNQPRPAEDLKKIEDAYTEFLNSPYLRDKIPVAQAQEIKSGGGSILRKKYGMLGPADVEIDKALVRGFKEELEKAVPGIKDMNAREQNLINTLLLVDRRAAMNGNMNPGGLTFLAHNPAAAAAFMADRSSPFKSALALLIDANKRTVPQAIGNVAGGAAGAYSGQRQ